MDGAVGTVIHGLGVAIDRSFDAVNLDDPALIAGIHAAYLEAGADIIETNSFGANRFKLAAYRLENEVVAINRAAVAIARRALMASFKPVLLAGSVGPLGARLAPLGRVTKDQAEAAFAEQIEGLVAPPADLPGTDGVDLLVLETISDLAEMKAAIRAARRVAPHIPIVAMMTFTRDDQTAVGEMPAFVAAELSKEDVDVIGVNCSGGPAQILRLTAAMRQAVPEALMAAAPNAGFPEQSQGGRVFYPATPAYFGEYAHAFAAAGVNIVGGCCGTTADHIRAMRLALDAGDHSATRLPEFNRATFKRPVSAQTPAHQPTQLAQALANEEFVVTVEMSPPRGASPERQLAAARMLKEAGATFINAADNPLARMRMSAWAAAYLMQERVGIETILHFPTRGRNLLRIHGDLLAAHAMGIRNLFVVMGDPTRIGDYPDAMDAYDIVPTGLIQMIKQQLNAGMDKTGAAIDQPTAFVVGCALNLTPSDPVREMKLLRKKALSGADFALTQPVFDFVAARNFLEEYAAKFGDEAPAPPIIAGIKPLYNSRNAKFLHHEAPGISIPLQLRERMSDADQPQAEGVMIAQELLASVRTFAQGVYLMPAFGRYDLVADVIDAA